MMHANHHYPQVKNMALAPLAPGKSAIKAGEALAEGAMTFVPPTASETMWRSAKLVFALPWRRFHEDSVLVFKVGLVGNGKRDRTTPSWLLEPL